NKLLEQMENALKDRQSKGDQQSAQELKSALESARKSAVTADMKSAAEQLGNNRLNQAVGNQRESEKKLQNLVKELEDRREAELDRLAKRMRELEKNLDQLTQEQEHLQKKVREAAALADPQKREEELKRLAREQQRLQQKAQEMAETLSRMRQE